MTPRQEQEELKVIQANSDAILDAVRTRIALVTGNAEPIPVFITVGDRHLNQAIVITNIAPPAQAMRLLEPLMKILPSMATKTVAPSIILAPGGKA